MNIQVASQRSDQTVPLVGPGLVALDTLGRPYVVPVNPFTHGDGDPPEDGTILTWGYWDDETDVKYYNSSWPITAAPTWEQL